ncbi:MAG: hypothetical protein Q8K60_05800 [Parachlamydiaceae bacterium]|nr:hypothetical protein [Parachlamydiaceae bacterium]
MGISSFIPNNYLSIILLESATAGFIVGKCIAIHQPILENDQLFLQKMPKNFNANKLEDPSHIFDLIGASRAKIIEARERKYGCIGAITGLFGGIILYYCT